MPIVSIKCHNFKIHKDLNIDVNGKSFIVVGDSGTGKSTLLDIILSSYMMKEYPENPLTDGADTGWTELVHEHEGMKYTIKRSFDRKGGLKRFTVVDENKGVHTLTTLLEKVLGPSFKNNYFDYRQFFFKEKSTAARYEYMINAIGGQQVVVNNKLIKEKIKERATIGSQRNAQKVLVDQSGINQENVEADFAFYHQEKKIALAGEKKAQYLQENLVDLSAMSTKIELRQHDAEHLLDCKTQIISIDSQLEELERKIAQLKEHRESVCELIDKLEKNLKTADLKKMISVYEVAVVENNKVTARAQEIYDETLQEVMTFNQKRAEFFNALKSLKEWKRLETEWEEMTAVIDELKVANREIFRERLPIPELSVEEDEEGNEYVAYKGREFSFDNLSKGETIKITAEIQRSLNPKGNNFIVIPEAQSLGSKLDEVMDECKEFGIQAIVEMTERDQKLQIKVQ